MYSDVRKTMQPHMWVLSKAPGGGFLVTIGDPRAPSSRLIRVLPNLDALRDWVRDEVGRQVSPDHVFDATGNKLVSEYYTRFFAEKIMQPAAAMTVPKQAAGLFSGHSPAARLQRMEASAVETQRIADETMARFEMASDPSEKDELAWQVRKAYSRAYEAKEALADVKSDIARNEAAKIVHDAARKPKAARKSPHKKASKRAQRKKAPGNPANIEDVMDALSDYDPNIYEDRIAVTVDDQGDDDPEADAALRDINSIVRPLGWAAHWTGSGDTDQFGDSTSDIAVEPSEAKSKRAPRNPPRKPKPPRSSKKERIIFESGYAYEFSGENWRTGPDDAWETVMQDGGEAELLGRRTIDGSAVVVGRRARVIYAQSPQNVKGMPPR